MWVLIFIVFWREDEDILTLWKIPRNAGLSPRLLLLPVFLARSPDVLMMSSRLCFCSIPLQEGDLWNLEHVERAVPWSETPANHISIKKQPCVRLFDDNQRQSEEAVSEADFSAVASHRCSRWIFLRTTNENILTEFWRGWHSCSRLLCSAFSPRRFRHFIPFLLVYLSPLLFSSSSLHLLACVLVVSVLLQCPSLLQQFSTITSSLDFLHFFTFITILHFHPHFLPLLIHLSILFIFSSWLPPWGFRFPDLLFPPLLSFLLLPSSHFLSF